MNDTTTLPLRNPRTGQSDGQLPSVPADAVAALGQALRAAQPAWAALDIEARCQRLSALADALVARRDAMVELLLAAVVVGLVVALVTAASRGHARTTFALILLGLPNLVWPALTVGLGATWNGRVDGPFGLPVPHILDVLLRTPDVSEVNLRTLTEYDGRMAWLPVAAAVPLLGVAGRAALRSPPRTPPWLHAVRLAVALALTLLAICLLCRISAHYGLSLLGIGDLGGGLSGELLLRPRIWQAVGLGALWGLVAGFLGALLAPVVRRGRRSPDGHHERGDGALHP